MRTPGERGQSEVLSTLLLVGLVLVLAATTAWAFFGLDVPGLNGEASATPVVSMTVEADESGLRVTHDAGTDLPVSELQFVVRSEGTNERVSFTEVSGTNGDSDGRFEAGETVTFAATLAGYADVRVVHEPTGTVLYRGTSLVGGSDASGPPALAFDTATARGYDSQDGSGSTSTSGSTLEMTGNTWKRVDYPYTVTADTMLVFEFRSDAQAEIHAIGFDDDNDLDRGVRLFQLYGTQSSQSGWQPVSDFDTYSDGTGWRTYTIPVGQYYTGDMTVLVLGNDCDGNAGADCSAPPTSAYRNVQVYEKN
jgi:flagellin-like protein